MSVSITLPNNLEEFLNAEATRRGVPLEKLLSATIEERWSGASRTPHLSGREAELLKTIETAFPPEQSQEWKALRGKIAEGAGSDSERQRFLEMTEERDLKNADRLEALGELALLRGVTVRELMANLGIRPE